MLNTNINTILNKKAILNEYIAYTHSEATFTITLEKNSVATTKGILKISGTLNGSPCEGAISIGFSSKWYCNGGFITYLNHSDNTITSVPITCEIDENTGVLTVTMPSFGVYGVYYLTSAYNIK